MSDDYEDFEAMRSELERILKNDTRFGPLHTLSFREDDTLMLSWDNAKLRPKIKSMNGAYLKFMEEVSDCLADYNYGLEADEGSNEWEKNDYFLIVPDDEDFEDDFE